MAKKRVTKKRRVTEEKNPKLYEEDKFTVSIPKSMVVTTGRVSGSVKQLMRDTRRIMLPWTTKNLRVARGNVLKDFLHVASPLHISHVMDFSQSTERVLFRIGCTKGGLGPTFAFAVESYSLCSDVAKTQKTHRDGYNDHRKPPVVILQGFGTAPKTCPLGSKIVLELASCFGGMFPRHDFSNPKLLAHLRRVMLVQFDGMERIRIRHYGSSFPIHKEPDVPLQEIGPRMDLRLLKVFSGAFRGDVIYEAPDATGFGKIDSTAVMTERDWDEGEKAAKRAEKFDAKLAGEEVSDDGDDDDDGDGDDEEEDVARYRRVFDDEANNNENASAEEVDDEASTEEDDDGSE